MLVTCSAITVDTALCGGEAIVIDDEEKAFTELNVAVLEDTTLETSTVKLFIEATNGNKDLERVTTENMCAPEDNPDADKLIFVTIGTRYDEITDIFNVDVIGDTGKMFTG